MSPVPQASIAHHPETSEVSDDRGWLSDYGAAIVSEERDVLHVSLDAAPTDSVVRSLALRAGKRVRISPPSPAHEEAGVGPPPPERRPPPPVDHASDVLEGYGSVIELVDAMLARAIERNASDIHLEPAETGLGVRYRIDGVLQHAGMLRPRLKDELTSRVKIMAGMDIAEKRRPQDGRQSLTHGKRPIDLRISTLPTVCGEKVVIRIHRQQSDFTLDDIGMSQAETQSFRAALGHAHGLILVTGPTGSGKTTTLYAALRELDRSAANITTIEDPVEYRLEGVNQVPVHAAIGVTFACALRSILRQDPDVIMIGEIRDAETLDIALRAALTGHLVLSTLHANDAPSTLARMRDMGGHPMLMATALRLVIAQRLLRRRCVVCTPARLAPPSKGFDHNRPAAAPMAGCATCNRTGYAGRLPIFQVMAVDEAMADLLSAGEGTSQLRALARSRGVHTLRDAGLAAVQAGHTTLQEVLRQTEA